MTEITFDTMAAVRRLRDSGISEEQAEAITQTVRDGVTGGVATKADLAELKAEMKIDIGKLETELKWIKLIGGAILAVLILPWLAEIVAATMGLYA
ncbi:hypothetical protein [Ruegeria sp.]|uniref:hypothetical protein n=1 Tax=Ruegeria sp. TaxID=1879320 RepID=UPI003AFFADEE